MDIFNLYATNEIQEQEGKEFDFGGGVTMKIGRSQNPRYQRMMTQLFEAHKHTLELKSTEEEVKAAEDRSRKIMAEVMSKSVLLGWSGPVTYKGDDIAYSVDNAYKLLLIKDFQAQVAKRADDFKNFRQVTEDADVKNSVPTSGGSSPGVTNSNISSH